MPSPASNKVSPARQGTSDEVSAGSRPQLTWPTPPPLATTGSPACAQARIPPARLDTSRPSRASIAAEHRAHGSFRWWNARGWLLRRRVPGGRRPAGWGGALEVIVDGDDRPAGGVQNGGGDAGAVSGLAVDPDRRRVTRGQAGSWCRGMCTAPLMCDPSIPVAAHVQDGERPVVAGRGQVREVATGKVPGAAAGPAAPGSRRPPPAGRSMPIRARSRWASATCRRVSPISVSGVPRGISQPR